MLLCRAHQKPEKIQQKEKREKPIASLWFAILFFHSFPRLKLAIHPVRQFQLGENSKQTPHYATLTKKKRITASSW
jgi:hypothetical protein